MLLENKRKLTIFLTVVSALAFLAIFGLGVFGVYFTLDGLFFGVELLLGLGGAFAGYARYRWYSKNPVEDNPYWQKNLKQVLALVLAGVGFILALAGALQYFQNMAVSIPDSLVAPLAILGFIISACACIYWAHANSGFIKKSITPNLTTSAVSTEEAEKTILESTQNPWLSTYFQKSEKSDVKKIPENLVRDALEMHLTGTFLKQACVGMQIYNFSLQNTVGIQQYVKRKLSEQKETTKSAEDALLQKITSEMQDFEKTKISILADAIIAQGQEGMAEALRLGQYLLQATDPSIGTQNAAGIALLDWVAREARFDVPTDSIGVGWDQIDLKAIQIRAKAAFVLAEFYVRSEPPLANFTRAVQYLRLAAAHGSAQALKVLNQPANTFEKAIHCFKHIPMEPKAPEGTQAPEQQPEHSAYWKRHIQGLLITDAESAKLTFEQWSSKKKKEAVQALFYKVSPQEGVQIKSESRANITYADVQAMIENVLAKRDIEQGILEVARDISGFYGEYAPATSELPYTRKTSIPFAKSLAQNLLRALQPPAEGWEFFVSGDTSVDKGFKEELLGFLGELREDPELQIDAEPYLP